MTAPGTLRDIHNNLRGNRLLMSVIHSDFNLPRHSLTVSSPILEMDILPTVNTSESIQNHQRTTESSSNEHYNE